MTKIFISHSRQDEEIKDFFFRAFAGTGVHQVLKEYEDGRPPNPQNILMPRNMPDEIERDIETSSAVFVILSETVERLPNTSHWIVYEAALAKAKLKPLWVFEPAESRGKITVEIPYFNHFVRFGAGEEWRQYIQKAVSSYRDTPGNIAAGAGLAGWWLTGHWLGAVFGFLAGDKLSNKVERPKGVKVICPFCAVSYEVHLPQGERDFRCAACGKDLVLTGRGRRG